MMVGLAALDPPYNFTALRNRGSLERARRRGVSFRDFGRLQHGDPRRGVQLDFQFFALLGDGADRLFQERDPGLRKSPSTLVWQA